MNKTRIEWCDFTWNPITGCLNDCFYCYARRMAERFQKPFYPEFHADRLNEPFSRKKSHKIFTCSVSDFWGVSVMQEWRDKIYDTIRACPQHQFQILTKQPHRIRDWSKIPSKNVWMGITICEQADDWRSVGIAHTGIRFISFEPLMGPIEICLEQFDWIVIGAMTGPGSKDHAPQERWVINLLDKADKKKIPIFMKGNLKPYWNGKLRQEWPNE